MEWTVNSIFYICPGEEILLSASYDDTIKCWAEDGGDWYCAATLSAHTSTVWCLACTLDGTRLISASDDSSIAIWKCYTGSDKQGYHGCVSLLEFQKIFDFFNFRF